MERAGAGDRSCINARGNIVGYTIGNDMSSRDIEGENPLYLSQAKIYDGACALGTRAVRDGRPASGNDIDRHPRRSARPCGFRATQLLHSYDGRRASWSNSSIDETSFPGCILLTGTGIVPDADFTLGRAT
jgi:2-dehydro-3-deoxy-D-arabinonate dehydratase